MKIIARIHSEFSEKFGIPRQSGLVAELMAQIVFEPDYRNGDSLRGLEGFSHLWLIWEFSEAKRDTWSPTVRPPRLGGNERLGVFATRSPYRPNPIGLSCVKLERIDFSPDNGPILHVSGADLLHGTPIFDMKPYLPYADCRPEATGGFASEPPAQLAVEIPPALAQKVPAQQLTALRDILALDPRPPYQNDPARVYCLSFGGLDVKFSVVDSTLCVHHITIAHRD